jgi:hypothetical protein
MPDVADDLRSYVMWLERDHPVVDPVAIRAKASASSNPDDQPIDLTPHDRSESDRRRRGLVLAAAVFVVTVAVAAWVLVIRQPGVTSGPPNSGSTVPLMPPKPTELPAVGDDPIVSCHPERGQWFRRSALDGPTGAENDQDPPAKVLKQSIDLSALASRVAGGPLMPGLPTSSFRRVATSDDRVLFEAGDYTGPMPLLSFTEIRKVGDDWQLGSGGGGGTCNGLFVQPPDGGSVVGWRLDHPDPSSTTLHLLVSQSLTACDRVALTPADLIGPDVVESDSTVTINIASRRLESSIPPDCPPPTAPPPPLALDVRLRAPLGERKVLDATVFPARSASIMQKASGDTLPEASRLVVPGGTHATDVQVIVNSVPACELSHPETCTIQPHPAHLTVSANGAGAAGDTNSVGMASVVIPDGVTRINATADGLACGSGLASPQGETVLIGCTRLDRPHGSVEGDIEGWPAGLPLVISIYRADNPTRTVQAVPDPVGAFTATLESGDWVARADAVGAPATGCRAQPRQQVTVTNGTTQTIHLACSP